MNELKMQIECKLRGIVIEDWCSGRSDIIFNKSLCSQEHCIRFATPMLKKLFPDTDRQSGVWHCGCFALYEIYNDVDKLRIGCSVSRTGMSASMKKKADMLFRSCGIENGSVTEIQKGQFQIMEWVYTGAAPDSNSVRTVLDGFAAAGLAEFELQLSIWELDNSYIIRRMSADSFSGVMSVSDLHDDYYDSFAADTLTENQYPRVDDPGNVHDNGSGKDDESAILTEGALREIITDRYERDRNARRKCIEAHGTACCICGFDFGKVYGDDFTGKIEVHHIVPLYSIKKDHIVDPVKDLIPVCPNCHMILHSKPCGVYTPDEVRKMIAACKKADKIHQK